MDMKKLKQYLKSFPLRVAIGAIFIFIIYGVIGFNEEKPAPNSGHGILEANQESTDTALRVMASRPLEPEPKR